MRDGVIIIFMVLLSNFLLTASFFVTRESLGFLARGGAKSIKSKQSKGKGKVKAESPRKSSAYDDDEDEDDDIHFSQKTSKKLKGKKESVKSSRGNKDRSSKKMQIIPWMDSKGKRGGINWKERLEQIAKQGQAAYKEVYRRAKVLRSSAFEGILLKATWPGDAPVPQEILTEIVKHSIPSFKYGRSEMDDDPYYMTLHKLWTKMCEKDWRTVVKSLYIFHCISRDCNADDCGHFSVALRDMSKTRNPKKPDHKYFDLSMITELDALSEPYEKFVKSYASFVLFRAKWFRARFEELKEVSTETSEKKAVALIKRAQQLISLGLQCIVTGKDQINLISGYAIRHVANDLRDLYKYHSALVAPFLTSDPASQYAGAKLSAEEIQQLLTYHEEVGGQITQFLEKVSKSFSKLRIKISSDLATSSADSRLAPEKLQARLQELKALSGGFCAAAGGPVARKRGAFLRKPFALKKAVEEDEEEEEDDEEEDDEEDEDTEEEEEEEKEAAEEEETESPDGEPEEDEDEKDDAEEADEGEGDDSSAVEDSGGDDEEEGKEEEGEDEDPAAADEDQQDEEEGEEDDSEGDNGNDEDEDEADDSEQEEEEDEDE